jgi:hypothetical protein
METHGKGSVLVSLLGAYGVGYGRILGGVGESDFSSRNPLKLSEYIFLIR